MHLVVRDCKNPRVECLLVAEFQQEMCKENPWVECLLVDEFQQETCKENILQREPSLGFPGCAMGFGRSWLLLICYCRAEVSLCFSPTTIVGYGSGYGTI